MLSNKAISDLMAFISFLPDATLSVAQGTGAFVDIVTVMFRTQCENIKIVPTVMQFNKTGVEL